MYIPMWLGNCLFWWGIVMPIAGIVLLFWHILRFSWKFGRLFLIAIATLVSRPNVHG
jgi:hypothetical protein